MMKITRAQFDCVLKDFLRYAGEGIKLYYCNGSFLVYGSKLAILKIANRYRYAPCDKASNGYSKNLQMHYFKLALPSYFNTQQ